MAQDYVSDWLTRLRAKVYLQFQGKPKLDLWIQMIARQFQDLEDAAQSILTVTNLDASIGAQLDVLGRRIGQIRNGLDDATYRTYIRARIVANHSNGTAEDIYKVFRALLGSLSYRYVFGGTKAFVLRVLSTITLTQMNAAISFLRDSKETGARAILEWQPVGDDPGVPTDNIFRFDVIGHGFDQAVFGEATKA